MVESAPATTSGPTAGATRVRTVVADDEDLSLETILLRLAECAEVDILALARSGVQLIELVGQTLPDLVVTDINMPDMDGITAATLISAAHPRIRILVVSLNDAPEWVERALAAGAHGYLLKNAGSEEFAAAVRTVLAGTSYVPPLLAQGLAARQRER